MNIEIKQSLSPDQKQTLIALTDWLKNPKGNYISVGGYAGTGKTTMIALLSQILHQANPKLTISFASYTGKATRVLKTSLQYIKALEKKDTVSTIHSLIYEPMIDNKQNIIGWNKKDEIKTDLIIIDEASMVDGQIWQDLLSYNIPIIAVGDHGQLPPIQGNFNLMGEPHLKLEKIHRQAENNPIIKLSMLARTTGKIPTQTFAPKVKKFNKQDYDAQETIESLINQYNSDTLILCGYNNTRIKLNNHIRSTLGFDDPNPMAKDKVICLRNNHKKDIYNGMIGTINKIQNHDKDWYYSEINLDDENQIFKGLILKNQFNSPKTISYTENRKKTIAGDLFDYGYALTVHKAQGSQAHRVILFEERFKQMDDQMWRRWLYTAVTRAVEELYIIGN